MTRNLDSVFTALIAVSAFAVAGSAVLKHFRSGQSERPAGITQAIEYDSLWSELASGGVSFGAPAAPIVITEFADLECPSCRRVHKTILEQQRAMPDTVRLVVHHFPLDIHRFARQAAQAFECADSLGDGLQFLTNLYEYQDSIGLRPWKSYAIDGNVKDLSAFEACRQRTVLHPRILEGLQTGARHGVRATPTVFVNGWRFKYPPNSADLHRVITSLLTSGLPPDL